MFLRETNVFESNLNEPVGSSETDGDKVKKYLQKIAKECLGLLPLADPEAHLSPKYGLSGWCPLSNSSAVHLYAWDAVGESYPPFLSVDISTPAPISYDSLQNVIDFTSGYFNSVPGQFVYKSSSDPNAHTWRELNEDIIRQRVLLSMRSKKHIIPSDVIEYMRAIVDQTNMVALNHPVVHGNCAWMHWETSGCIAEWSGSNLDVDVYTCKAFDTQKVVDLSVDLMNTECIRYKSF